MSRRRLSVATQRPVCFWSRMDVEEWLRSRHPKIFAKYGSLFLVNHITGRVLVEMTENCLGEMGVTNAQDRHELLHEIMKVKLKGDLDQLVNSK